MCWGARSARAVCPNPLRSQRSVKWTLRVCCFTVDAEAAAYIERQFRDSGVAPDLVCFDMGGTSCDVCVVEGGADEIEDLSLGILGVGHFASGNGTLR